MQNRYYFELRLCDRLDGKATSVMMHVDHVFSQDYIHIAPPSAVFPFGGGTMEAVVDIMKRKEMRKELFPDICNRLGHLLAERLEDEQGWHGNSHQENTTKMRETYR